MKHNSILFSILFSILAFSGFAQENFIKGFIINLQDDTVFGLIESYNQIKNPEFIQFKEETNSQIRTFIPTDIKRFMVGDNMFLSALVQVNFQQTNTEGNQLKSQMRFLRIIAEGPKSLFCYTDQSKKDHFYIKDGDVFVLLLYRDQTNEGNSSLAVSKDQRYKGQLMLYFQDFPELKNDIERLSYNENSLTDLFRHYLEITKESTYIHDKNKLKIVFGIIGGMGLTRLSTVKTETSMDPKPVANGTYSSDFLPVGGVFFEVILPKTNAKWSLFAEGLYSKNHFKGEYSITGVLDNHAEYLIDISLQQLLVNAGVRYWMNANKFRIFINGGFSYGINLSSESSLNGTQYYYGRTTVLGETEAMQIAGSEPGFLAGTGIQYKRLSTEIRYKHGLGFTPNGGEPATTTNQISFMLGVKIF